MEFDFARLFERVVARLLQELGAANGLELRLNTRDRQALEYLDGRTYRAVEPDITVWRDGSPVAVVDAKFKPRYVGGVDGQVSKVTSADIYQLLFYQSRLHAQHPDGRVPLGIIVSPIVVPGDAREIPDQVVLWKDATGFKRRLSVVSISLLTLMREVILGRRLVDCAEAAMPALMPLLGAHLDQTGIGV